MNYSIRPESHELQKARSIVEEALATAETRLEKDEDFEVHLCWDYDFSAGSQGPDNIWITFNTEMEDWEEELRTMAVYGYAHSVFFEKSGMEIEFNWQDILITGFGQMLLEETLPEEANRYTSDVEPSDIQNWSGTRQQLGNETGENEPLPWQLSYLIAEKLAEKHELEDFPELTRSDVLEAGDEIFE